MKPLDRSNTINSESYNLGLSNKQKKAKPRNPMYSLKEFAESKGMTYHQMYKYIQKNPDIFPESKGQLRKNHTLKNIFDLYELQEWWNKVRPLEGKDL